MLQATRQPRMETLLLQELYMNVTGPTFGHTYKKHNLLYKFNPSTQVLGGHFPGCLPVPYIGGFRDSSCTCLSLLCRRSLGHTWHSPGDSRDSSLKKLGDGQVSQGSSLCTPPQHLRGSSRKPGARRLWDMRARSDLSGPLGSIRAPDRG